MMRYCLRLGTEPQGAITVLDRVVGDAHHEFWADDVALDASVLAAFAATGRSLTCTSRPWAGAVGERSSPSTAAPPLCART